MGMFYEFLYGCVGFLWVVFFVNKYVGEGIIFLSIMVDFIIYYVFCFEFELGSFVFKSLL